MTINEFSMTINEKSLSWENYWYTHHNETLCLIYSKTTNKEVQGIVFHTKHIQRNIAVLVQILLAAKALRHLEVSH